ncbi:MAG: DUF1573 domain-containing protein [Bacteroidota bacterium]
MTRYLHLTSLVLFFSIALLVTGCNNTSENSNTGKGTANDTVNAATAEFRKTTHDFGKIITGERVAYAFRFTNSGNRPLIITGIRSGCGCTVGDYPKDPVKPGEEGKINVVFNSAGRRGFQSESVKVLSNSEESVITLRITAEVLQQ